MEDVYIIGIGQIPVRKHTTSTPASLGAQALVAALNHAQVEVADIGAVYAGNMMSGILSQQQLLAPLIASQAGLSHCEAITAESSCGSGAAAMRLGCLAIAAGAHRAVAVCGAEQMSHCDNAAVTRALATASHWPTEGALGESFLSLNAKLMQVYLHNFKLPADAFADFAINAHSNACHNANAMLHKSIDLAAYRDSRTLVEPLCLFDAPPIGDGAAALILATEDLARAARSMGQPVVRVIASAAASDELALGRRNSLLKLEGAQRCSEEAYRQSGLTPADIDVFELHDAYTIMSVLALEAAGFADFGCGANLAASGDIALDGSIPISTFGGLKARGHPVGATGVYQLAECFLQLTGTAGDNQVADARIAMAQNFGGAGTSVFTHILESV